VGGVQTLFSLLSARILRKRRIGGYGKRNYQLEDKGFLEPTPLSTGPSGQIESWGGHKMQVEGEGM